MTYLSSFFSSQPPSSEGKYERECWSKETQKQSWSADSSLCTSRRRQAGGGESKYGRGTLSSLPCLFPPVLPLGANGLRAIDRLLNPVVVMEPNTTAWCVFVCTPAAHPVGTSIRQVMVVRFGVPAAQGNIPALVLTLTLLTGVIPVQGVLIPARIHCPHSICLDKHLEVVAGALQGCQ